MAGCKIGAFLSTGSNIREKLSNWRKDTGTVPKIVCSFHALGQRVQINHEEMNELAKREIIPLLKIEPWEGLKPILSGEKRLVIENLASDLKDHAGEIRMTLGHEMNVSENRWYPWQGNSGDYVRAVNYFAEKIYKSGANNIKLVYNVNVHDSNLIEEYYPGDEAVSYLAVDGYNWGRTQSWGSRWQEFSDIFGGAIIALREINKDKPVMIGEFSSTEANGSKAAWIKRALPMMKNFNIESFIWFDIKKEQDWRVNSSPESAAAFQEAAKNPYFLQGLDIQDTIESVIPRNSGNVISKLVSISKTGYFGGDGVSIGVKVKLHVETPKEVKSLRGVIVTNQEWPAGSAIAPEDGKGEADFYCFLHPANRMTPFMVRGYDENRRQVYESEEMYLKFPD
jgi:hypothetical protein